MRRYGLTEVIYSALEGSGLVAREDFRFYKNRKHELCCVIDHYIEDADLEAKDLFGDQDLKDIFSRFDEKDIFKYNEDEDIFKY